MPQSCEDLHLADRQAVHVRWQRPRVGEGLLALAGLAQQPDSVRAEPGRMLLGELSSALVKERHSIVKLARLMGQVNDADPTRLRGSASAQPQVLGRACEPTSRRSLHCHWSPVHFGSLIGEVKDLQSGHPRATQSAN